MVKTPEPIRRSQLCEIYKSSRVPKIATPRGKNCESNGNQEQKQKTDKRSWFVGTGSVNVVMAKKSQ